MQQTYTRLSSQERETIGIAAALGKTFAEIAKDIGRNKSTVCREIHRDRMHHYNIMYAVQHATWKAAVRRRGKHKLATNEKLWEFVKAGLLKKWSPNQIERRLKMEYPDDTTMRVSGETIYAYVYVLPRTTLRKQLIACLRREHKYRRPKKTTKGSPEEKRGKIADMLSIEERPAEVADRIIPGHWEGDLIIGKYKQSAIGTLVERTTRYTMIVPLTAKDAVSVAAAYAAALQNLPKHLAKTLTYDQGKEMSGHKQFTIATDIAVYFAHPASPWERGTNENTNGLIRQYFPKGTDFRIVTSEQLWHAQNQLNGRPRKVIGYQTPYEAFTKLVALEH